MKFLDWINNLPAWIKNLIGLVSTLVGFILLVRTNFHLGIAVTVVVLWLYAVGRLVNILLSRNKVERRGILPQPRVQTYTYASLRPWAAAGLVTAVLLMAALIGYPPTRNVARYALIGTPTALPAPTPTPGPPDLTLVTTTTGEGFCFALNEGYLYVRQKSVVDLAVNNNSDRIVVFQSVALVPQAIDGEPFLAGGLSVVETYSVSVADWLNWMATRRLGERPATPTLQPLYVDEIITEKYSLQPHTAERFQLILGVSPEEFIGDYYLYGTILVQISLDNGQTLQSEPVEIMVCGSTTPEEFVSTADALLHEGAFAFHQGDIERAILQMRKAANYEAGEIGDPTGFESLCDQGVELGYAEEALFGCDWLVGSDPGSARYRELRGIARAVAGDLSGASEDFEHILSLDGAESTGTGTLEQLEGWIAQLQSGQNPFAGEALLYRGVRALRNEDTAEAVEYFHQAQELGFDAGEAVSYWQNVCLYGSLRQIADQVLFACDTAVELNPEDERVHDSRGIARALAGDYSGAIEDFEFVIERWEGLVYFEQDLKVRQAWIVELQQNKNPITDEFLAGLQLQ